MPRNTPTQRHTQLTKQTNSNYSKFYCKNQLWRIHVNKTFSTKTYIRTRYKTSRKKNPPIYGTRHIEALDRILDQRQSKKPQNTKGAGRMYTKHPRQIVSLVRRSDRTTSKRSRDTTEANSSTYPRAPRKRRLSGGQEGTREGPPPPDQRHQVKAVRD